MKLSQGDILWIDLDPARGTETKKNRPCLVISNALYNQYFNTVIVVPISTSEKYRKVEKYIKSPLFVEIKKNKIQGTALLQHVRAVDPSKLSNGQIEATLTPKEMKVITSRIQQFY